MNKFDLLSLILLIKLSLTTSDIHTNVNNSFFNSSHHHQNRSLTSESPTKKSNSIPKKTPKKPDETILTNKEFVPPYIDEMIQKYKTDDNNIFFVITPINKNIFHGDISHSNVNAMAGGKGNKALNYKQTLDLRTAKIDQEIKKIMNKLNHLSSQNNQLLTLSKSRNRRRLRKDRKGVNWWNKQR